VRPTKLEHSQKCRAPKNTNGWCLTHDVSRAAVSYTADSALEECVRRIIRRAHLVGMLNLEQEIVIMCVESWHSCLKPKDYREYNEVRLAVKFSGVMGGLLFTRNIPESKPC
jgi:hypothetical protein